SRVGAPASQSRCDRDALQHIDAGPRSAGTAPVLGDRTLDEVGPDGLLPAQPAGPPERHLGLGSPCHRELVGEIHRLHHRLEVVVAVGPHTRNRQEQVDLGAPQHSHRRTATGCALPGHPSTSALLAKSSRARASARAPGSTPAAASAASMSAAPRPRPTESALRSVLRRWEKLARTTRMSGSAGTVTGAGRRVIRTSTESTPGCGQNTVRGTGPRSVACACRATNTLTAPYTLDPGPATSRSPASRCTMTTKSPTCGTSSSMVASKGVAML